MEHEYDLIVKFVKAIAKRKLSEWLTAVKEWLLNLYRKAEDLFYKLMDIVSNLLEASSA